MGVHGLWTILQPTARHAPLDDLAGKRVAIDLAIWVVDDMQTQREAACAMPGRLHLRNLFFRTAHLLKLGARPLFVIDGEAPVLKAATMAARQASQQHKQHQHQHQQTVCSDADRRRKRMKFRRLLRGECCRLLDLLGVPHVESPGEAESMAALLNSRRVVDIVVTNDGDAFLYGAEQVLRNFSMNSRNAHVHWFDSGRIATELGLTRDRLVALALLLGCDYAPKGVPGVGRELAMKFMRSLPCSGDSSEGDVLARLIATIGNGDGGYSGDECDSGVWRRVATAASAAAAHLPAADIAHEFLQANVNWPIPEILKASRPAWWRRPRPIELVKFCQEKLDWAEAYTLAKVMPLLCLWDSCQLADSIPRGIDTAACGVGPRPKQVLAERVRAGVPCYEVEFDKLDFDAWTGADTYVLCVPRHPFGTQHAGLVDQFQQLRVQEKQLKLASQKQPKPRKKKEAAVSQSQIQGQKTAAEKSSQVKIDNFFQPLIIHSSQLLAPPMVVDLKEPKAHRSVLVDSLADLFSDISLAVDSGAAAPAVALPPLPPSPPAGTDAAASVIGYKPLNRLFKFKSCFTPSKTGGTAAQFALDASLLHLTAGCSSPLPLAAAVTPAAAPAAAPLPCRAALDDDSFDKFVTPPRLSLRMRLGMDC